MLNKQILFDRITSYFLISAPLSVFTVQSAALDPRKRDLWLNNSWTNRLSSFAGLWGGGGEWCWLWGSESLTTFSGKDFLDWNIPSVISCYFSSPCKWLILKGVVWLLCLCQRTSRSCALSDSHVQRHRKKNDIDIDSVFAETAHYWALDAVIFLLFSPFSAVSMMKVGHSFSHFFPWCQLSLNWVFIGERMRCRRGGGVESDWCSIFSTCQNVMRTTALLSTMQCVLQLWATGRRVNRNTFTLLDDTHHSADVL